MRRDYKPVQSAIEAVFGLFCALSIVNVYVLWQFNNNIVCMSGLFLVWTVISRDRLSLYICLIRYIENMVFFYLRETDTQCFFFQNYALIYWLRCTHSWPSLSDAVEIGICLASFSKSVDWCTLYQGAK